jgi:hypothetical protein
MDDSIWFSVLSFVLLFTGSTLIDGDSDNAGFHWWVGLLSIFAGVGCLIASIAKLNK